MIDAHLHASAITSDMTATGAVVPDVFLSNDVPIEYSQEIWRCVGVHPMHASALSAAELREQLSALLDGGEYAAIGEFGLDKLLERKQPREAQERAFEVQLELSEAYARPIVLHIVRRHGRALSLLGNEKRAGLVHDFQGSMEVAAEYLRRGLHLSVGPAVLDPQRKRARAAATQCPLDRLLIETDAESPARAAKLGDVLSEVARLRGIPEEALSTQLDQNVRSIFEEA